MRKDEDRTNDFRRSIIIIYDLSAIPVGYQNQLLRFSYEATHIVVLCSKSRTDSLITGVCRCTANVMQGAGL